MTDRAFVYCIEMEGGHVAKVGSTCNPRSRLNGVASTAPFKMRFRHCLEVASRQVASAWEKIILAQAERYRERGEWVCAGGYLDDLFAEVTNAVCVLDEVSLTAYEHGRRIDAHTNHYNELAKAELKSKFGAITQTPTGNLETDIIRARLSEGYGAEDCQVLDGIPADRFRAEVRHLREIGKLASVLRGYRPAAKASA